MKKDVAIFSLNLSRNIFDLHSNLLNKTYQHGGYIAFAINDPKPRSIHKASVRDRLFHHAVYRVLYPYFDKKFIFDSYSCRNFKGTHRPLERFCYFARKVSRSNKRTCWVLKCDIRKFFASIDQSILMDILKRHNLDSDTLSLLGNIITSFETSRGKGMPLGNLTSQLLVNVYMNEFDQFVKHKLKVIYYIRYADDFVILHHNKDFLTHMRHGSNIFLEEKLKLKFHPDKVFIKTLSSGVDFLGWVHFPHHRILRTVTKRRMMKKLSENYSKESKASYLGLIKHGNTYKLKKSHSALV